MPLNSYKLENPLNHIININSFTITVSTLELFSHIDLIVTLYNQYDKPCATKNYKVKDKLYKEWMEAEDDWLVKYVERKLKEEFQKETELINLSKEMLDKLNAQSSEQNIVFEITEQESESPSVTEMVEKFNRLNQK